MAHRRKISLLVLAIAALSLSSCSSSTPTPSTSPTPSVTPTASPTDTFDSEILLANNELEEEFLQAALDSCELTKTKSLIVMSSEGILTSSGETSHVTYFRPAEREDLLLPENQVSENSNGDIIPGVYNNNLPGLFDLCLLEEQAALVDDPNAEVLEHTLEKINPYLYAWSQHQGGANLETMYYEVKDGLITMYSTDAGFVNMTELAYTEFTGDIASFFVTAHGY